MKRVISFGSTCFIASLTAVPAFADTLGGFLGGIIPPGHGGSPVGAPAPLLAAGIPAFIAIAGGALVIKLVRRHRDAA